MPLGNPIPHVSLTYSVSPEGLESLSGLHAVQPVVNAATASILGSDRRCRKKGMSAPLGDDKLCLPYILFATANVVEGCDVPTQDVLIEVWVSAFCAALPRWLGVAGHDVVVTGSG